VLPAVKSAAFKLKLPVPDFGAPPNRLQNQAKLCLNSINSPGSLWVCLANLLCDLHFFLALFFSGLDQHKFIVDCSELREIGKAIVASFNLAQVYEVIKAGEQNGKCMWPMLRNIVGQSRSNRSCIYIWYLKEVKKLKELQK